MSIMKITVILTLFFYLYVSSLGFAEVSTSQIERTQEILEKEKALMEKLEKKEKVFIKQITVEGAISLNTDRIKEIILPFQKKWLTEDDIQGIIDSLKRLYHQQGKPLPQISYCIKGRNLFIKVEEKKS